MAATILRLLVFTVLPLLLAGLVILLDTTTRLRARRWEAALILLFAISVGAAGIFNFVSHLFLADEAAAAIGWAAGSPFQSEVAFANLAIGLLGVVAVGRRDGFREATVLAVTVFSVGATVVHLLDILATGNLAPGNTVQNVANLLRPALLITALAASRRAERAPTTSEEVAAFERWRAPLLPAAGGLAAWVSTAYGTGYAVGQPGLGTLAGAVGGALIVAAVMARRSGAGKG